MILSRFAGAALLGQRLGRRVALAAIVAGILILPNTALLAAAAGPERGGLSTGHPLLVDDLGDTIPPGPRLERIISLSPNLTEILFALGVDPDRIAGVTRFCDYPPAAKTRPVVGGIVDPSLETIQMAHPDLVLAARGNPRDLLQRIRDLGITVFAVDDRTGLEGIHRIVSQVATLVEPDDREMSARLLRRLEEVPRAYRAWSDSIPDAERPTVYYADPEHPEWSAGPGSHVDDLIRLAGGSNAVRDPHAWPQISPERLLLIEPDRLLLSLPEGQTRESVLTTLRARPGWANMTALREERICWVPAGELLRPGPRLLDALETFAACLHPERPQPVPAGR